MPKKFEIGSPIFDSLDRRTIFVPSASVENHSSEFLRAIRALMTESDSKNASTGKIPPREDTDSYPTSTEIFPPDASGEFPIVDAGFDGTGIYDEETERAFADARRDMDTEDLPKIRDTDVEDNPGRGDDDLDVDIPLSYCPSVASRELILALENSENRREKAERFAMEILGFFGDDLIFEDAYKLAKKIIDLKSRHSNGRDVFSALEKIANNREIVRVTNVIAEILDDSVDQKVSENLARILIDTKRRSSMKHKEVNLGNALRELTRFHSVNEDQIDRIVGIEVTEELSDGDPRFTALLRRIKYKYGVPESLKNFIFGLSEVRDMSLDRIWDIDVTNKDFANLLFNKTRDILEYLNKNDEGGINTLISSSGDNPNAARAAYDHALGIRSLRDLESTITDTVIESEYAYHKLRFAVTVMRLFYTAYMIHVHHSEKKSAYITRNLFRKLTESLGSENIISRKDMKLAFPGVPDSYMRVAKPKSFLALARKLLAKQVDCFDDYIKDRERMEFVVPAHIFPNESNNYSRVPLIKAIAKFRSFAVTELGSDFIEDRAAERVSEGGTNPQSTGKHRSVHLSSNFRCESGKTHPDYVGTGLDIPEYYYSYLELHIVPDDNPYDHDLYEANQISAARRNLMLDVSFYDFTDELLDMIYREENIFSSISPNIARDIAIAETQLEREGVEIDNSLKYAMKTFISLLNGRDWVELVDYYSEASVQNPERYLKRLRKLREALSDAQNMLRGTNYYTDITVALDRLQTINLVDLGQNE